MIPFTKTELIAIERRAEEQALKARQGSEDLKARRLMDLADAAEAAARVV